MQFSRISLFKSFLIVNLFQFKYSEAIDGEFFNLDIIKIQFCMLITNLSSLVNFMVPGSSVHVVPEVGAFGFNVDKFKIYCYAGGAKEFLQMLNSISLKIEIESDDYLSYAGYSKEDVEIARENHKSIFSFNFLTRNKKRDIKLNPFNQSCIGIETANEYKVFLSLIRMDLTKLILLISGVMLFFSSAKLSKNSLFFYMTGVLLGVFASFLILFWFCSKLIPKVSSNFLLLHLNIIYPIFSF